MTLTVAAGLACGPALASTLSIGTGDDARAQKFSANDRPLVFESNVGQYAESARYVARGANYCLTLTPDEFRVVLQKRLPQPAAGDAAATDEIGVTTPVQIEYRALQIRLVGANPNAVMSGDDTVSTHANYFLGADASKWRVGVPAYERVRVAAVYPGINLLHYGNQNCLEYDFQVAPGSDPGQIAMQFAGADELRVDAATGDLLVKLGAQNLRQPKPVIYQIVDGKRVSISGGYRLSDALTVKFTLGDYDLRQPLVIDPVVSYSKLFGGPLDDTFWAIAVDPAGSVYIAGETLTPGLATRGAFQTNYAGKYAEIGDVIVAKFGNRLDATNYITYLGGSAAERALALAVDGAGNAYLTGYTDSTNFPLQAAIQTNIPGPIAPFTTPYLDAFVAKISPSGSNLVFSTFFGGSADDYGWGIALDASTNVFVVGQTVSTNLPTKNTTFTNLAGATDGFVLKLDAAGTNVVYAMYLGGSANDIARDVTINPAGNPLVTGYTGSTNFPVTIDALQLFLNQTTNASYADDAFLVEVSAAAGSINYSTFLGGTNSDRALRLAVDANGAAYLAGWTQSGDFPQTSTNFYTVVVSNTTYADAFVAKLNQSHTNLDYAVTFGGGARDMAWDVAVDSLGRASIIGETASLDFPTTGLSGILKGTNAGGIDVFIAQLNPAGSAFTYSAYLGSPAEDVGYGVTVDAAGNAYFVGRTASASFPLNPPPSAIQPFSDRAGFVVKMRADEIPPLGISASATNINLTWSGLFPELTVQSSTNLLISNSWVNVPGIPTVTNAQLNLSLTATNSQEFFRLQH